MSAKGFERCSSGGFRIINFVSTQQNLMLNLGVMTIYCLVGEGFVRNKYWLNGQCSKGLSQKTILTSDESDGCVVKVD